jgi:hypothetical protein
MTEHAVRTGRAALVLLVAAASALLLCVGAYALSWPAGGTAAGIAALFFAGASFSWLSEDGRRLRDDQRRKDDLPGPDRRSQTPRP